MIKMNEYYPWCDWPRSILAIIFMTTHQGMMSWKLSENFAVHVFFYLNDWPIEGALLKTTPDQFKWMEFIFHKIIFVYNYSGIPQLA